MVTGPIKAPVSGASSFHSLVHTDDVGQPQKSVVIALADVRASSHTDLDRLRELQNGFSNSPQKPSSKFSWNLNDFLKKV